MRDFVRKLANASIFLPPWGYKAARAAMEGLPMSIATASRLKKLSFKHREAAKLIVHGWTLHDVGKQVGFHPFHLGRLINHSPLFQKYLCYVIEQNERQHETVVRGMHEFAIMQKLDKTLKRIKSRRERGREHYRKAAARRVAARSSGIKGPAGVQTPPLGSIVEAPRVRMQDEATGTAGRPRPLPLKLDDGADF